MTAHHACPNTPDLLERLRGTGLAPLDHRHLERCETCHEAVTIEALLVGEGALALEEARAALPTPETTLHRMVNRERQARERRAFLLLRAMQGTAFAAGLLSLFLVIRWLAPGLTASAVESLAAEETLPGKALWAYLAAGGLVVFVLAFFRGWFSGGVEGE